MASVRLPRMCCPVRDVGTDLVFGFSPGVYHAVCACSAVLGLWGTGLCYYHSYSRKKRQAVRMGGNVSLSSFLVTAGILLNSVLWLSIPDFLSDQTALGAHILCVGIATWIHYFCSALFWAFFCFSLEVVQLLTPTPSKRLSGLYTSLCWGVSSLVGLHGLLMLVIPSTPDDRCETSEGLVLFHDALVYIPLILALFGSPVLLRKAMSTVPMVLRMQCGVYTSTERFRKHSLRKRLLQINGAFIACWLVNVLCDFLLFLLEVLGGSEPPRKLQVAAQTAWFITGILNPMFCALHSLAYFGWRCNRGVCQSSLLTESHPGVEGESNSALEEEHQLLGMKPPQITGKLSFPNILQFMDSWSSVEFSCSALEINAVRLLGARDSGSSTYVGSSLQPQHSV
ncbi:G-protein coupled receptor 143-like [Spea bombifrons]|uniref:G-protein coupled receptor 143-like n=1 Tax=Spea bombifrons TaxID=233779 RepID=UPI00234B3DA5|nr:G-protein coupled receptor 143-like [Spea bombifrons]